MEDVLIDSIEKLKSYFTKYDHEFLFRGQTRHHLNPNNEISISTSFGRYGCVPPLMFKWMHYSKALIRAFGGGEYHDLNMGLSQSILQHYGWRSFFIDLTKSTHIACWFAANRYKEKNKIHMCEDFEENPVWLVHKDARYENTGENGHIYVIDPNILKDQNIEIHDLSAIKSDEGSLRFHVQHACLAGTEGRELACNSIIAHLEIENHVLAAYYQEGGINTVLDVFPDRDNDYILKCLLEIPWHKISSDNDFSIPVYRRSLEIPEYDLTYIKHLSSDVTLFNDFWISQNRNSDDSPFANIPFFRISEYAYYASSNEAFDLSEVNKVFEGSNRFVVELDGLINVPELTSKHEFEKGIYVEKISDDIVSVLGLVVTHPGHMVTGVGANLGWCYKIEGQRWEKIDHDEQCPCNNDLRHELQFSLLRALNESLMNGDMCCEDPLNYYHKDVIIS